MSSNIIKADENGSDRVSPLALNEFIPKGDDSDYIGKSIAGSDMRHSPNKAKKPDMDEIKKLAFEEGFNKGMAEGVEIGRKEAEPVISNFLGNIGEVTRFKQKILNSCETDVVELVVAAAQKIVQKEISLDKEIAASVIRNALKSLTDRKDISVRINPLDYDIIHERKSEYFGDIDGLRDVTFVEDDLVSQGGCMIESRFGEVDARIEKQMEALEQGLKNVVSEE